MASTPDTPAGFDRLATASFFANLPNVALPEDDIEVNSSQVLRFGDHVVFQDHEAQDGCVRGVVHAPYSTTPFSTLAVKASDSAVSAIPTLGDARMAVFQIIPPRKYKAAKRFREAIAKLKATYKRFEDKAVSEVMAIVDRTLARHAAQESDSSSDSDSDTESDKAAKGYLEVESSAGNKQKRKTRFMGGRGDKGPPPKPENHKLDRLRDRLELYEETKKKYNLAQVEHQGNLIETKRQEGDSVHYGTQVQLLNVFSNKLVRINPEKTGELDANNLRIDLTGDSTRNCWFKIMPFYRLRSEGDMVRMGDRIKFESVKALGQYIHTSDDSCKDYSSEGFLHEVNISPDPASWTLLFFKSPDPPLSSSAPAPVKGFSIVQLQHKEMNAYLAAEGTCGEITQDVHLRIRKPEQFTNTFKAPTTAVTFWQVEPCSVSGNVTMKGEPLKWDSPVRLKHVTTQMYLTLTGSEFTLTREADQHSLFMLHAVFADDDFVSVGDYARIQNFVSENWMHANSETINRGDNKVFDADGTDETLLQKLKELEWDTSVLTALEVNDSQNFVDAFVINPVDPHLARPVAMVAGFVPKVREYCELRTRQRLSDSKTEDMINALEELTRFVLDLHGQPIKSRQKLLRNFGLVDLLVDLVNTHFQPDKVSEALRLSDLRDPPTSNCQRLVAAIFSCIGSGFLAGQAKKNELYVSRYIPLFQMLLGTPLGVEKMYTELVTDNGQLIDLIGQAEIRRIVSQIKPEQRNLSAGLLELLSALCVDEEIPRQDRQEMVLQELLGNITGKAALATIEQVGGVLKVNCEGADLTFKELKEKFPDHCNFVQKQLDLLGKLCAGRFTHAVEVVKQELPFDVCYLGASSKDVPYEIRAEFAALLLTLFVDEGKNVDVLATVQLAFDCETLKGTADNQASASQETSLSGASNKYFGQLKTFILSSLRTSFDMAELLAAEAGEEKQEALGGFMMEVLNLLLRLVRFGYYDDADDIKDLTAPLWATLIVHHIITKQQKQQNASKAVKAKLRALEVLDALMNFSTRWRLQHLLYDFYTLDPAADDFRPRMLSRVQDIMSHTASRGRERLQDLHSSFRGRRGSVVAPSKNDMDLTNPTLPPLPALLEETVFARTADTRHYLDELQRISSWCVPLGQEVEAWLPQSLADQARKLHYTSNRGPSLVLLDLANEYNDAALSRESLILLDRINAPNHELLHFAENALLLEEPDKPADGMVKLSQFLFKRTPGLRMVSTGSIDSITAGPFIDDLQRLTQWSSHRGRPNFMAQEIIEAAGVVDIVLDALLVEDGQNEQVLDACLKLLKALCIDNEGVQNTLFRVLGPLLKIRCKPTHDDLWSAWAPSLGHLLQTLFDKNLKLCLDVKRTHLEAMVEFVKEHEESASSMFTAMECLIRVELPEGFQKRFENVKRNQQMIMKYITKHHADVVLRGRIGKRGDETLAHDRIELLHNRGDDDPLLQYHLKLLSLLAACSEGDVTTQFIESMTQTALSPYEVIDVVLDNRVDLKRRRVYIRYFLWSFTKTTVRNPDLRRLLSEPRVWDAMDQLGADLLFHPELQSDPEYRSIVFDEYFPWIMHTVNVVAFEQRGNTAVVERVQHIAESLMKYTEFVSSTLHTQELPLIVQTFAAIEKFLGDYEKVVPSVVGTAQAIRQAKERLAPQASAPPSPQRRYTQALTISQKKSQELQEYVRLLRKSYNGKNKVKHQFPLAGSKSRDPYTENEDGDEALPLGPEFQQFVHWFAKYQPGDDEKLVDLHDRIRILVQIITMHLELRPPRSQDRREQDELSIRAMQILRAIIHNEKLLAGKDREVQVPAELCRRFDVCLPLMNLLSLDDKVAMEALACMAAILADYNPTAQRLYLKFFRSTREERFFLDVSRRIDAAAEHIGEVRTLLKQLQSAVPAAVQEVLPQAARTRMRLPWKRPVAADDDALTIPNPVFDENAADTEGDTSLPLHFEDDSRVELVLRIIQKLCEGHFVEMQEYMRVQPDNFRQIDLTLKAVQIFQILAPQVSQLNIELELQAVTTLTELVSGNGPNQERVFKARCLESVNEIIRNEFEPLMVWPTDQSARLSDPDLFKPLLIARLKLGCAKLVLAMIENSDALAQRLASEMRTSIDIRYLFVNMQYYFTLREHLLGRKCIKSLDRAQEATISVLKDTLIKLDRFEDFCILLHEASFTFFHVLQRIHDLTGTDFHADPDNNPFFIGAKPEEEGAAEEDLMDELGGAMNLGVEIQAAKKLVIGELDDKGNIKHEQAFSHLKKESTSIEILRDDEVQCVHFQNNYGDLIRENVKEKLKWAVDRSSPQSKIEDFDDRSRIIIEDIRYAQRLKKDHKFLYFLLNHAKMWSYFLLLITIIINVLILATWKADPNWSEYEPVIENSWYDPVMHVLEVLHLVAASLVCLAFYIVAPPSVFSTLNAVPLVGTTIIQTYNKYVAEAPNTHKNRFPKLELDTMTRAPLFSVEGMFHIALPVFSVLGIVYDGYFYAFHLLHIIVDNDILLRVIQSVTKNGRNLIAVAILMIIIIYLYALASFAFLRKNFDESEGAYCQNAFQCFVTSVKLGLMSGGGLGEALPPTTYGFEEPGVRVIFDLSFFIIINIIALNVVFGIIVDTFSELRDEKFQAHENMTTECFICSLPSDDFDRVNPPVGFADHVKFEHNMWDYICFILYLQSRDPTELTAHEEYVWQKWQDGDTSWYPRKRALRLDEEREADETKAWQNTVTQQLSLLIEKLDQEAAKQNAEERTMGARVAKETLRQQSTMMESSRSRSMSTLRRPLGRPSDGSEARPAAVRLEPPETPTARSSGVFGFGPASNT